MLRDLWSELRFRLRALTRGAAVERDLDDEVRFHLEQEARKLEAEGHSPAEARRRARLEFGGVERIKEESRDVRGISLIRNAAQDLRYAARGLRSSPGFTLAVIGTLALGIGANAAMFAIVDQLLFRTPPFLRDAGRVHRVYLQTDERGRLSTTGHFEYTRFVDLTEGTRSFDATAAVFHGRIAVGTGPDAREMSVAAVSGTLWDLFDAVPVIGRFFRPEEDRVPKGTPVAVLSWPFWQSRYGGRRDAVGSQLRIGPVSYTVIGVAPEGFVGFQSATAPAAFIPITSFGGNTDIADATTYYTNYSWGWIQMVARRKPGITAKAASTDLTQAYLTSWQKEKAMRADLPPADVSRPRAIAAPVQMERGPNQTTVAKVAQWVSGVALIVLIIACANVANLLLARALNRRREIGLRLALGVTRARLFSQLITESLLLAGLGGLAGLAVAQAGGAVLRGLFLPDASDTATAFDWRTMAFAGTVTLVAGVLTGLAPILQARRADVAATLKIGARDGTHRRSGARDGLLLLQGALSVILLVGAGLFVRSLERVRALRLGYDVDRIVFVNQRLDRVELTAPQQAELSRRLHQTARNLPEAEAATMTMSIPFWMSRSTDLFVEGIDSVSSLGHFSLNAVSPEYFTAMGTRLLRGRGITVDDRAGAPLVMVVSDEMASVLWPGADPIGKCVRVEADSLPCTTVVGVAESIRRMSISSDNGYQYYLSAEQFRPEQASLLVRTRGRAADHAEAIRAALQREMPGESYLTVMPLETAVAPALRSWELGATMFLAFGGLALVLAGVGLYSVVAYNVVQRRHELGLRIALGATARDLLRLVMGEGLRFAMIGMAIGGAASFLAAPRLEPLLYQQSPRDPGIFLVVAVILAGVAALASAIPATRAARVDPNVTLRTD